MTHIDICNLPENSCCGNCDLHREAIELLVSQARQEEREALKKLVESRIKEVRVTKGLNGTRNYKNKADVFYNQALSDLLNELNKN